MSTSSVSGINISPFWKPHLNVNECSCNITIILEGSSHPDLLVLATAGEKRTLAGMKTRNVSGFTLLEMLVAIAIACLLSLGGWRGWHDWQQRQQLDDCAQQIRHLLQRIRSDANWHNAVRLLWLKPGARWCLGAGSVPARCRAGMRHALPAPYPGIRVQEITAGTGFYGKNSVAHAGRIVISSPAGERRVILSARGRVRICAQSEEQCR
nr:prepilin-type N-terminal cleavage/methylation domain-containing protein [Erwinia sp. Ejp617]